jgi:hypothetical protein
MEQLIMKRKYINNSTKETDCLLDNIITNKTTLNNRFISSTLNEIETPFNEISIVKHNNVFDLPKLNESISHRNSTELNLNRIVDELRKFIHSTWDNTKFNLVFHSSGYDSRVISYLIKEIYDQKPGNILFACLEYEANTFREILKYEGWDDNIMYSYDEWSENNFVFKDLWKQTNVSADYPLNVLYCFTEHLKRVGKIPTDNLVIWGGSFFNEVFLSSNIGLFLSKWYYSRYPKFFSAINHPYIHPILGINVLNEIFGSIINQKEKTEIIRRRLCAAVDSKLESFPRSPNITNSISVPVKYFKPLVQDFERSFYFNNINKSVKPSPKLTKNAKWWTQVTLASYIEELVKRGVNINV